MKVVFHEQLSLLCLLSEVTSDAILGNGELNVERNVDSIMDLTKSIQCLKIRLKLKYVLILTWSLTAHTGNLGWACAHIFQKRT